MQRPLIPIFDGHNDVLSHLAVAERDGSGRTFLGEGESGHIDLAKARAGGLVGGLFSVWAAADPSAAPPPGPLLAQRGGKPIYMPRPLTLSYSQHVAMEQMGALYRVQRRSEGAVRIVRSASELDACLQDGAMAAVIHFEGAEPIDPRLDTLDLFYEAGLRSVGPVWSRPNDFGEGVPYLFPHTPDTGPGLTDAGKALVSACGELGIVVDVSHLNERGFWDVAAITQVPMVATHSNAHALTPSPRNLTDRQLDAIRDSRGIVGVNFFVGFLREDGDPDGESSIARIVEHMQYLVDRMGIEHVGFGADMDGAKIPSEVGDATGLPKVIDALRAAGFDDASLRKLGHENWLRVLRATWR